MRNRVEIEIERRLPARLLKLDILGNQSNLRGWPLKLD